MNAFLLFFSSKDPVTWAIENKSGDTDSNST